jgi:Rod binding domain-containing protein
MDITRVQSGTSPESASSGDDKKFADAAVQFEAMLVTTLLRSAKESTSGGWMGTGEEDQSLSPAIGMAEEQLAAAIANQGGLGIARIISQQPGPQSHFTDPLRVEPTSMSSAFGTRNTTAEP